MNPDNNNNNKEARIRIPKKKRPTMSFTNSYISDEDDSSSSFNNLQPNSLWKKIRRPSDIIEEVTHTTPSHIIEEETYPTPSIRDNFSVIGLSEASSANTSVTPIQPEEIASIESKIRRNRLTLDANEIDCFVQNYEYFKTNYSSLKVCLDHSSSRIKPTGDTKELYMPDEEYRIYQHYLSLGKNYHNFLAIDNDRFFKITINILKDTISRTLTRKEISMIMHAMYLNNNYIDKEIVDTFIDFYQKITGKKLNEDDTFIFSKVNIILKFRIEHGENFLRYITEVYPRFLELDFASRKIFYNFKEIVFHIPNESDYGIPSDIWILNELYFDYSCLKVANITYDDRNRNSIKKIFAGTILRLTTDKTWLEIMSELSIVCAGDSARKFCLRAKNLPGVLKALIAAKALPHIYNTGNVLKKGRGNRSKFDEKITSEAYQIIGNARDVDIIRSSLTMKDIIKSIDNFEEKISAMRKARSCIQKCSRSSRTDVSETCRPFFEEYGDRVVALSSSRLRF